MPSETNKIPSAIKALSFEEALSSLEEIVRQLEGGRIKLEDAVSAYEKGIFLKNHCEEKLKEAKVRIEKISVSQDGDVTSSEAFDTDKSN